MANRISGKIILKESGAGLRDLLVVIYDVDPGTQSEEARTRRSAASDGSFSGDRLGSVLTQPDGTFELSYEDGDYQIRNSDERRPDLFLLVLAGEEPGGDLQSRILYSTSVIRENAGRTEQYLIRLPAEHLEKAGIQMPLPPAGEINEPEHVLRRFKRAAENDAVFSEGLRSIEIANVNRTRANLTAFEKNWRPALRRELSQVPEGLIHTDGFVGPGQSVLTKNRAVLEHGIKNVINSENENVRPKINGVIALTEDQKKKVAAKLDNEGNIDGSTISSILGAPGDASTHFVQNDPVLALCREKTREEKHCLNALAGLDETPEEEDGHPPLSDTPGSGVEVDPNDVELIDGQSIKRYIARLMNTQTSPEERVLSNLEPRASREGIEENLRDMSFPPSPADTPSYYDFHNLQIAFEHVWQEAIDEGALDLAQSAYQDIVELGGEPKQNDHSLDFTRAIINEARLVLASRRERRDHRQGSGQTGTPPRTRGRGQVRDHRGGANRPPWRPDAATDQRPPDERLPDLLQDLEERMREAYSFTVYAANRKERSVNFGLLVTYRQKWDPLAYQAGKLAKTITLAPKEVQRYSKKSVVRRKRAEREVESHMQSRREETSQTSRAEQEIVRKATTKTNFSLSSQDSISIPVAEGISAGTTRTTSFSRDAEKTSQDVKKAFRESIFKAAQEYKDEHTLEVNTEESEEIETVESGEIMNPNDEIAVTFLFYELQRRYRVSEKIHRLQSVVLVAQEVPRPDEIDEDWLIAHDWILRRVLLDDSFLPALNFLSQNVVGEEAALHEMRENIAQQRQIVEELRRELGVVRERMLGYRNMLERPLIRKAEGSGGGLLSSIPVIGDVADAVVDTIEGLAENIGDFMFPDNGNAGQSRQDALKEAMQRTADEERDLLFRLEREVTALNNITEAYSKALSEHMNHKTQVARLRVHIKQNILYYMQALWHHEPPDQRYFRLHKVQVPTLEARKKTLKFRNLEPDLSSMRNYAHMKVGRFAHEKLDFYPYELKTEVDPDLQFTTLAEVADLDTLLGYKGNYMIFPLKKANALTDYMSAPYVVAGLNELSDADDIGNWTIEDFAKYVCCLKKTLSEGEFAGLRAQLTEQYKKLLTEPRRDGDIITVPTSSLFIEALPARHSLIEEFKARHRAIDVKKVQAEVRARELENIRLAARLLDGELDDPEIERKIVVEGNAANIGILDGGHA